MKVRFTLILLLLFSFSGSLFAQNALDFDGVDDKVDCGGDTSVDLVGSKMTLEAWIYPTAWKTNVFDGNVICKEENKNNYGYMLRVGDGGKLNFAFGDGSWHELTSASAVLSLNTWQHIAGTYDGQKMRIFVNGAAVDSMSTTGAVISSNGIPLLLGAHSSYTRYYQGIIDEVRVWRICRTPAQIAASMNDEICKPLTGLMAYYKFNHGKAGFPNSVFKSLTDLSGHKNTGTLNAFALTGTTSNWVKGKVLYKAKTYVNDTQNRCERYISPSGRFRWTSSGVYKDTIPTYMGCDSVITTYLTIRKATSKTIKAWACKSYVSPSGLYTWTKSGTYTDYLINSVKCDSIITVVLQIGGSYDTMTAATCRQYLSPSKKYVWTASGAYQDTISNYRGCDSVITVNLTIYGPSFGSISDGICKSYMSPSKKRMYYAPGSYQDTLVNHLGCDSIVTVSLKSLVTASVLRVTNCYRYTAPGGKKVWSVSGNYYDTLVNTSGCDSIINVKLTILQATGASLSPVVCRYFAAPSGKRVWSRSGTYKDTLKNFRGCDSIITVNLQVIRLNANFTRSGNVLTAIRPVGAYQWMSCGPPMVAMSDGSSRSFTVPINGSYTLEVSDSGCRDTSTCMVIAGVAVSRPDPDDGLVLGPDPSDGNFFIRAAGGADIHNIMVYNLSGQLLLQNLKPESDDRLTLSLPPGRYMLRIQTEAAVYNRSISITPR